MGVVVHQGPSLQSGHYWSYVRRSTYASAEASSPSTWGWASERYAWLFKYILPLNHVAWCYLKMLSVTLGIGSQIWYALADRTKYRTLVYLYVICTGSEAQMQILEGMGALSSPKEYPTLRCLRQLRLPWFVCHILCSKCSNKSIEKMLLCVGEQCQLIARN